MEIDNNSIRNTELKPLDKSLFIKEHESISSLTYKNMIKSTAIIVIYSAAAVASSTSLVFIPNLETITIFIFLVSFYYGFKIGFSMMLTTSIIYELFASIVYGFSGPLFFFKLFAYSFTVLIASNLSNILKNDIPDGNLARRFSNNRSRIGFLIVGVILTLLYDLITTTYSYFLVQNVKAFILLFIAGLPYIFFHELTNGIIFFFIPDYLKLMKLSNTATQKGFE